MDKERHIKKYSKRGVLLHGGLSTLIKKVEDLKYLKKNHFKGQTPHLVFHKLLEGYFSELEWHIVHLITIINDYFELPNYKENNELLEKKLKKLQELILDKEGD